MNGQGLLPSWLGAIAALLSEEMWFDAHESFLDMLGPSRRQAGVAKSWGLPIRVCFAADPHLTRHQAKTSMHMGSDRSRPPHGELLNDVCELWSLCL